MNNKSIYNKIARNQLKTEKQLKEKIQEQNKHILTLQQELIALNRAIEIKETAGIQKIKKLNQELLAKIEILDNSIKDTKNLQAKEQQKILNKLNDIIKEIILMQKQTEENTKKIKDETKGIIETTNSETHKAINEIRTVLAENLKEKAKQNKETTEALNNIKNIISETRNINKEILWAETFKSTVTNSSWLKDTSFSPGRWAVGYQYLYAVYRILNIVKPQSLLELGLGQSTKLLSQYAKSNPKAKHIVIEHDEDWIKFYKSENGLAENSEILKLEREYRQYKNDDKVLAFKDFKERLEGQKFDFISIDAPLGGTFFARIDVLSILPECLKEDFVIVIDDYNRQGEKNTVSEIESILKANSISYAKGIYYGEKQCMVICAEKLKFITSM